MTQNRYNSLCFAMIIATVANVSITSCANAKTTKQGSNFYSIGTTSKTDFGKSNANAVLCSRHARHGFKQAFYDYSYAHQYQTCCAHKSTHKTICN